MNCKKCGAPLENNTKFCGICGTPVEQTNNTNEIFNNTQQPGMNINQTQNPQQPGMNINQTQNPQQPIPNTVPEQPEQNLRQMQPDHAILEQPSTPELQTPENEQYEKKKNIILPLIIILILLGVGVYFGYKIFLKKPNKIVESLINNTYEKLEKSLEKTNIISTTEPVLLTTEISGNTNIQGLEDLSGIKLKLITGVDQTNKKFELNGQIIEDNNTLIEAGMYLLNNKVYGVLKEIYPAPLKLTDEEINFEELLNTTNNTISEEDIKYIIKEYKEILIKSLNMNDFIQSSDTITLNNKETKVTKTSYTLDDAKAKTLINNIIDNTLKNEELIKKLAQISNTEIEILKQNLSETKITDEKILEGNTIKFNIYTKGITNDFAGLDIELPENSNIKIRKEDNVTIVSANLSGASITLNIKSENENKCTVDYKIAIATEEISGTLNVENKKLDLKTEESVINFSINYQDQTANLIINMKQEQDATIADIDVTNAKDINDLTEQEISEIQTKLFERLQNSKIYSLIMNKYEEKTNSYDTYEYDEFENLNI